MNVREHKSLDLHVPKEVLSRFFKSEVLAHNVIYQDLKATEQSGVKFKKIFPFSSGIFCCIFVVGNEIEIVFRGTKNLASGKRDVEPYAPGSSSFAELSPSIVNEIETALSDVEEKGQGFNINFYGHSLGGADAQNCFVALLQRIGSDKQAWVNLRKLRLHALNSPGVTQETAVESIILARFLSHIKFEAYWIHADGDPVQQTGQNNILLATELCDMHMLNVFFKGPSGGLFAWGAYKLGIHAHVSQIFKPSSEIEKILYFGPAEIKTIHAKLAKKSGLLQWPLITYVQSAVTWLVTAKQSDEKMSSLEIDSKDWVEINIQELQDEPEQSSIMPAEKDEKSPVQSEEKQKAVSTAPFQEPEAQKLKLDTPQEPEAQKLKLDTPQEPDAKTAEPEASLQESKTHEAGPASFKTQKAEPVALGEPEKPSVEFTVTHQVSKVDKVPIELSPIVPPLMEESKNQMDKQHKAFLRIKNILDQTDFWKKAANFKFGLPDGIIAMRKVLLENKTKEETQLFELLKEIARKRLITVGPMNLFYKKRNPTTECFYRAFLDASDFTGMGVSTNLHRVESKLFSTKKSLTQRRS